MRCLHCNKKLGLLKLAKGDSFCSPEHFDAHQLELSRAAMERLLSLDNATRAPLVIRASNQWALPPPQTPLARPAAYQLPAPKAAPLRSEPAKPAEAAPPPCARFARSALPAFSPKPALPMVTGGPEEDSESVRKPAFPVHEVQASVCILNLYAQLIYAATEPKDWMRHRTVAAEDFGLAIHRPALALRPEFLQIESAAPAEEEARVAAAPQAPQIEAAQGPVQQASSPEPPELPTKPPTAAPAVAEKEAIVMPVPPPLPVIEPERELVLQASSHKPAAAKKKRSSRQLLSPKRLKWWK